MKIRIAIAILVLVIFKLDTNAANPARGILNEKAPAWQVSKWLNLPAEKKALDITDFQDKVIYLYCFQSWCPGCHKYGFPALQQVIKRYNDDEDVAIVAVQTTFEGYAQNGIGQAREVARKYKLKIPIGQSGSRGNWSKLMTNYRTGGTPWVIIIDRRGIVRYNDFYIYPNDAAELIDRLKQKLED